MPFRNGKRKKEKRPPDRRRKPDVRIPPIPVKTVGEGGKPRSPREGKRTLDTCTARSGYLGPYVRRRARKTAKSHGEPSTGATPVDARMGEPIEVNPRCPFIGRTPAELKYLSKRGKEIKIRDSRSSDERNGKSPNQTSAKLRSVACLVL